MDREPKNKYVDEDTKTKRPLWCRIFSFFHLFLIGLAIILIILTIHVYDQLYTQNKSQEILVKEWADVGITYLSTGHPVLDERLELIAKNWKEHFPEKSVRFLSSIQQSALPVKILLNAAQTERCRTILNFYTGSDEAKNGKMEVFLFAEMYDTFTGELLQSDVVYSIADADKTKETAILNSLPGLENNLKEQFSQTLKIRETSPDLAMGVGVGITEQEALQKACDNFLTQEVCTVLHTKTTMENFTVIRDQVIAEFKSELPPVEKKLTRLLRNGNFMVTVFCKRSREQIAQKVVNYKELQEYFRHSQIGFIFTQDDATPKGKATEKAVLLLKRELLKYGFRIFDVAMLKEQFEALEKAFDIGLSSDLQDLYKKYPTGHFIWVKLDDSKGKYEIMVMLKCRTAQENVITIHSSAMNKRDLMDVVEEENVHVCKKFMADMVPELLKYKDGFPFKLEFLGFRSAQNSLIERILNQIPGVIVISTSPVFGGKNGISLEILFKGKVDPIILIEQALSTNYLYAEKENIGNWVRFVKEDRMLGIKMLWILYASPCIAILSILIFLIRCTLICKQ